MSFFLGASNPWINGNGASSPRYILGVIVFQTLLKGFLNQVRVLCGLTFSNISLSFKVSHWMLGLNLIRDKQIVLDGRLCLIARQIYALNYSNLYNNTIYNNIIIKTKVFIMRSLVTYKHIFHYNLPLPYLHNKYGAWEVQLLSWVI